MEPGGVPSNDFTVNFPATLQDLEQTIRLFKAWVESRIPVTEQFGTQLVVREMLSNAVLHGSASNPDLQVRFTAIWADNYLRMVIRDEGAGFDWRRKVADKHENELQPGGRGLLLLSAYGFSFIFNDRGNQIELKKKMTTTSQ